MSGYKINIRWSSESALTMSSDKDVARDGLGAFFIRKEQCSDGE